MLQAFPNRLDIVLPYAQEVVLTAGAGGVLGTEQIFQPNSIVGPSLTAGGHRAYGVTTLATLYRKFKVRATEVEITFVDTTTDGALAVAQFQAPQSSYTLTGKSPDDALEKPWTKICYLSNTGQQLVTLKLTVRMAQLCGLTEAQYETDVESYAGTLAADPALKPFLRIAIGSIIPANVPVVNIMARFRFHVQLYEAIQLAES